MSLLVADSNCWASSCTCQLDRLEAQEKSVGVWVKYLGMAMAARFYQFKELSIQKFGVTSHHGACHGHCVFAKGLPFRIVLRIAIWWLFIFGVEQFIYNMFAKTHIQNSSLHTRSMYNYNTSKFEQLNYCCFEGLLRISVRGSFMFRGRAMFSKQK